MFSTPSGRPASANTSPHSRPPTTGDHSDGFRTTVLPSASGAAIERADRMSAAFQGAIAPTTPTGLRTPSANVPGWSEGMTSPIGWYGVAAACRNSPGTKLIWNIPKPNVQPVSRASSPTTSSRRCASRSAAMREIACRAAGRAPDPARSRGAAASDAGGASGRAGEPPGERLQVGAPDGRPGDPARMPFGEPVHDRVAAVVQDDEDGADAVLGCAPQRLDRVERGAVADYRDDRPVGPRHAQA